MVHRRLVSQSGQNSPEVFVSISLIVVKMLTISAYFWTLESPYFGFTGSAALCMFDSLSVSACLSLCLFVCPSVCPLADEKQNKPDCPPLLLQNHITLVGVRGDGICPESLRWNGQNSNSQPLDRKS